MRVRSGGNRVPSSAAPARGWTGRPAAIEGADVMLTEAFRTMVLFFILEELAGVMHNILLDTMALPERE